MQNQVNGGTRAAILLPPMRRPVVALVGRPNVGKSSLFNRLVERRLAIVEQMPGVTRDRLYATATWAGRVFDVVDTGGFVSAPSDPIQREVRGQAGHAVEEADVILFVVDAREGLVPEDRDLAQQLREARRPIVLVANKVDDPRHASVAEFFELGLGDPVAVSALHGLNITELVDVIAPLLPPSEPAAESALATSVAIVGRPNVGKSSLVNAILGEHRVIVASTPGTTRDSIDIPLTRDGQRFVLIDTAGLRRKARIDQVVERYSADRALRAISRSDVVVLVLDATSPVVEQDQEIARYTQEQGRALVLAVNKIDLVSGTPQLAPASVAAVRGPMRFVAYAPIVGVSAVRAWGIDTLLGRIGQVALAHDRRIGTGPLNRAVEDAERVRQPPSDRAGHQLKIFYGTQVQTKPPTFVVFVNEPDLLSTAYRRYLEGRFRAAFDFEGTPLRLVARARERARRRS